jgi:hypothetical protein
MSALIIRQSCAAVSQEIAHRDSYFLNVSFQSKNPVSRNWIIAFGLEPSAPAGVWDIEGDLLGDTTTMCRRVVRLRVFKKQASQKKDEL